MRSWSTAGSAADPETSRRARPSACCQRGVLLGVRDEAVIHRRHAEDHRRALRERRGDGLRGEAPEVMRGAATADRPEDADDEAVHVEERQPVRNDVVGRPLPRVGQRVEVGGDRAARQDGALGRPRGARRVDDERGCLLVRLGPEVAAARVEVDVDARALGQRRRQLDAGRAEDRLRGAVVDDVTELALARLRVDGHRGDARQQRADDGDARLGQRERPHADALGRPPPGRRREPRRRAAAHSVSSRSAKRSARRSEGSSSLGKSTSGILPCMHVAEVTAFGGPEVLRT